MGIKLHLLGVSISLLLLAILLGSWTNYGLGQAMEAQPGQDEAVPVRQGRPPFPPPPPPPPPPQAATKSVARSSPLVFEQSRNMTEVL